jgi:hypothetical protein
MANDLVALVDLPPDRAAAKLRAVGEFDVANAIDSAGIPSGGATAKTFGFGLGSILGLGTPPWLQPLDVMGYLAPGTCGDLLDMIDISQVKPQPELRGARVNVTLQRLRTYSLPGGGKHTICFDFQAENSYGGGKEDARYTVSTTSTDGNFAAIRNFPMFTGLGIGSEGLKIEWRLINVKSEADEQFLDFLNSDVVRTGLKLAATAQPALGMLYDVASGLAKYLVESDSNAVVQDSRLGLDFSESVAGGRLALGSYVIVQAPQSEWQDWSDWAFDTRNGVIVRRDGEPVPYNYLIFGIDRYSGE